MHYTGFARGSAIGLCRGWWARITPRLAEPVRQGFVEGEPRGEEPSPDALARILSHECALIVITHEHACVACSGACLLGVEPRDARARQGERGAWAERAQLRGAQGWHPPSQPLGQPRDPQQPRQPGGTSRAELALEVEAERQPEHEPGSSA